VVPEGEVGAGGSFVIAIKWMHNLAAFNALAERDQEGVFDRTKLASIELDDDIKPPTAHIARVVIEDDNGEELEIFRRSVPYGTVSELGLYFLAFSADISRFERMLARMYGMTGDGLSDHLMAFTRAVSGSFFFAPSVEALAAMY
jgi:putative iron-dependent peroxidase